MAIKLQTIGIITRDMSKTLGFYRALGMEIPMEADQEGNVDFVTSEGITLGFLLEAIAKQADPNYKAPVGQPMNLQFLMDSPAEVDALYTKMTQSGYIGYTQPWDAFWGQRFARITDPDGRVVNIYAHLPE